MDQFLIVKLSSLGDIVQSFPTLSALKTKFPNCAIDWAVSAQNQELVQSHPLIRKVIPIENINSILTLRKCTYDVLFDLQGNCKSGLITYLAKAKEKVGFDYKTAREWPNVLATTKRFFVNKKQNISLFHLDLLSQYFGCTLPFSSVAVFPFKSSNLSKDRIYRNNLKNQNFEEKPTLPKTDSSGYFGINILVAPGSRWKSKKGKITSFLRKIDGYLSPHFYFAWGTEEEKQECLEMAEQLSCASLIDKMSLPDLQQLMSEMDLMIGMDSIALHLCATTKTPTFSLFGPTSPIVFKPHGKRHLAVQGSCPYGITFDKQCPRLRTCKAPTCTHVDSDELFDQFRNWYSTLKG